MNVAYNRANFQYPFLHQDEIFSRVHATLQPALSIGPPVGRLVGQSRFTFIYDFISLTSLLLPKWSIDLKYGPCPPADFGSRVSGLVLFYSQFWGT